MKGNFNQLIQSPTPVLVDFYADWCGPCKMQAPILKEVAASRHGKVKILKIDVDKSQSVAARFKVQSIPTLMVFKHGKPVWRQAGVAQKKQLLQVIDQHQ